MDFAKLWLSLRSGDGNIDKLAAFDAAPFLGVNFVWRRQTVEYRILIIGFRFDLFSFLLGNRPRQLLGSGQELINPQLATHISDRVLQLVGVPLRCRALSREVRRLLLGSFGKRRKLILR